jgi:hypothetical protein
VRGRVEIHSFCSGRPYHLIRQHEDTTAGKIVESSASDDGDTAFDIAPVDVGAEVTLMAADDMQAFIGKDRA